MFVIYVIPDWHVLTRTGSRHRDGARTSAASERQLRQIFPYQRQTTIVSKIQSVNH